ncbi:hypothetical protein [Nocardia sp. CNY236]|uniref:hypothetical protein n=1 Tax=Nocardia sp. CNY236 TaxID=1169152 RepID=UPI00040D9E4B|nr:hypothetical protein [Nocardia sp. CNY236]
MAAPSQEQIYAALEQMRTTASEWEKAAEHLDEAARRTADVEFTRIEAGVFAIAFDKYSPTPGYVRDRATEGAEACREIADTLRIVANVYEEEDRRREHEFRQLY